MSKMCMSNRAGVASQPGGTHLRGQSHTAAHRGQLHYATAYHPEVEACSPAEAVHRRFDRFSNQRTPLLLRLVTGIDQSRVR